MACLVLVSLQRVSSCSLLCVQNSRVTFLKESVEHSVAAIKLSFEVVSLEIFLQNLPRKVSVFSTSAWVSNFFHQNSNKTLADKAVMVYPKITESL